MESALRDYRLDRTLENADRVAAVFDGLEIGKSTPVTVMLSVIWLLTGWRSC